MSDLPRVLFLCTGNSCRSQMAEGWLRALAGQRIAALSAGTHPVGMNPGAVAAMAEHGIDIREQASEDIAAYLGDPPELVIAVCDHAADNCPSLPGATQVLRWPFPDPAHAQGTPEEIAAEFRTVCGSIKARLVDWLAEGAPPLSVEL